MATADMLDPYTNHGGKDKDSTTAYFKQDSNQSSNRQNIKLPYLGVSPKAKESKIGSGLVSVSSF